MFNNSIGHSLCYLGLEPIARGHTDWMRNQLSAIVLDGAVRREGKMRITESLFGIPAP